MGWGRSLRGPKGREWGKKILPLMQGERGGNGVRQNHGGRGEDSILRTRPTPLPSLHSLMTNTQMMNKIYENVL